MKRSLVVVFCAFIVMAIGFTVLLGWAIDNSAMKSVLPGFISMKANTAAILVLLSTVLIILHERTKSINRVVLSTVICIFVIVLSVLTLLQYLTNANFGIDEMLFLEEAAALGRFPPGRLAPITGVNFIFLSVAFLVGNVPRKPWIQFSQFLTILVFFSGGQAFLGYVMGMSYVFGAAYYTQMALHTAVGFILLSIATLLSRADEGYVKAFTAKTSTSVLVRRLLLAVLFAPPITRWASKKGFEAGLFDKDFETLILLIGSMIVTAFVVLLTGKALHENEIKKLELLALEKIARADAEKALQARDHFLSIASHELKTPLMSLQLQNEIVQDQISKKDAAMLNFAKLQNIFETSARQIEWLGNLITEMLDVTKIATRGVALTKSTVDLFALTSEVTKRYQEQFDSVNSALTFKGVPSEVECDKIQIERVLTNLVTNAFKYGLKNPVSVELRLNGNFAEIMVVDQGLGIAAGDQARIFEKYERAVSENEISGLGLGLFICKEIAEAHGGELILNSKLGEGSTFTLRLPIG